jgi:hypothetical protein
MNPTQPVHPASVELEEVHSFPPTDEIEHGSLFGLSLSNRTTDLTHGLHRFPAKFIPQVPAWALDSFATRDSVVLDPFMGSGTTLVEGLLRGGTTIGLDVDPLARLIARAKTAPLDADRLESLREEIDRRWTRRPVTLVPPMPDVVNFDHWFSAQAWGQLQLLLEAIDAAAESDAEQDFLLAVFSSILRRVSNADDQSQKTYVSGTNPKTPPPVRETFHRAFERAAAGVHALSCKRHTDATVDIPADGDATAMDLAPSSVDLAITSPPYLDSVDYLYNMMVEYFWLGPRIGVPDRATFNALRRTHVGAKRPLQRVTLPDGLESVLSLDSIAPDRQAAAATYFTLMNDHFEAVSKALKPGARYVFVVGNSQSTNGALPLHDALVRLAETAGLTLERAFGYRIRRHYMKFPRAGRGGIILIDWVLVLRKARGPAAPDPLPLPWITLSPEDVAH